MEKQRPYLDPELSLSALAKELGINRNQLSQSINDGLGENFYDFVNKYRVEEVKRLMADPNKQNYNLLGIAVEAGFKSKSTFNLIFKRFTGLTPTEYKKNIT
jgi:AraC-like DNA-binding protein